MAVNGRGGKLRSPWLKPWLLWPALADNDHDDADELIWSDYFFDRKVTVLPDPVVAVTTTPDVTLSIVHLTPDPVVATAAVPAATVAIGVLLHPDPVVATTVVTTPLLVQTALSDSRWIVQDLLAGQLTASTAGDLTLFTTDDSDPILPPFPGSDYASAVMDDNPVAYWRLDEEPASTNGIGTVFADETGVHPATFQNPYGYYTVNSVPGALAGDPNNAWWLYSNYYHYIDVPYLGVGDVPLAIADVFTLECWFQNTYVSYNASFFAGAGTGMPWLYIQYAYNTPAQGTIALQKIGSAQPMARTTVAIDDLEWHHVVATKDGSSIHLYLDGVDVTDPAVANETFAGAAVPWKLMQSFTGGYGFEGSFDEPAIYDYALSAQQVATHYHKGHVGNRGIRTAWGGINAGSDALLTVSTATSDFVPAVYLYRVEDPVSGTLSLAASNTTGEDIRRSLSAGYQYLIEISALDVNDPTYAALTLTVEHASMASVGMLLRGVASLQFGWRRVFDLGGIGIFEVSRPFDIETQPVMVQWRRPFDIAGPVGVTWTRPFDLGEGGALWIWSRPFDILTDQLPTDPGVPIPPTPVPVNAVQRIFVVGTITGGSFTLTFNGETTAAIAYDALAPAIQSALEALPSVDPGDITVTGGPLHLGHPVTLTFGGQYAGVAVSLVIITTSFVGIVTGTAGIDQTYSLAITGSTGTMVAQHIVKLTGTTEIEFSVVVPASGSLTIPVAIEVAALLAYWVSSDKNLTMTENDDGTPDLTVNLLAGIPWFWPSYGQKDLVVDVVSLKFANAGASDALVRGGFLVED